MPGVNRVHFGHFYCYSLKSGRILIVEQEQQSKRSRDLAAISCASAFLAVALGAFGAHLLKSKLSHEMMEIFKTGAYYQLVHAVAGLSLALAGSAPNRQRLLTSTRLFLVGTLIFCGSLYVLSITGIKLFGAITPIGGLCFLIGWLLAMFTFFKNDSN